MTINDKVRDEKLQYNINREVAKISALSSCKIHKYKYLTGKDILPSDQQQRHVKTIKKHAFDDEDGFQNKKKYLMSLQIKGLMKYN